MLDDEQLVNTLNSSKQTSQEIGEQLQVSEQTEIKIDAAREVSLSEFVQQNMFSLAMDSVESTKHHVNALSQLTSTSIIVIVGL